MDLAGMLVSIAVALAAAVVLTVLVTAIRVTRIRLKPMRSEDIGLARVPAEARSILDVGRRWLLPRGFRYVGSSRIRPMIAQASEWKYADKYLREGDGVFALVSPREQPRPGDATSIEFQSVFADGRMMVTMNRFRHAMVWEPPAWTFADDYVGDMRDALDNHVRRAGAHGLPPLADVELHDRVSQEMLRGYVDGLVAAKQVKRSGNGEIRFRFIPAVRYVAKLLRGNMRDGNVKVVPLDGGTPAAPIQGVSSEVAADLQAYQSRRAVLASATRSGKWKLGLLSAAAFVVLGGVLWDWSMALTLLGVIAFHEGGHYAAMKWVGYRNLNVFFLPGLGGLATGEKQDASAAQKVFVYLAGPMPGLVLATVGLLWLPLDAGAPWMREALMMMLVINAINLLPVIPLDGGRVLEVLLFMRWPRLRVAFALASSALLVAAGAASGDTVLLVIGVLVGLALPAQWRFAKLARRVPRTAGQGLDEQSAARRVFETLADASFRKWSFQRRATAADELIAELRTPVPGLVGMGAGLALYAACLLGPLVAAVAASPAFRQTAEVLWEAREGIAQARLDEDTAPPGPARNWAAELEQSKSAPPAQRLALLVAAAEAGFVSIDGDGALRDPHLVEMGRLADALPRGDVLRVNALRLVLAAERDDDRRQPGLRALLEELRDAPPAAGVERARVQVALAYGLDSTPERLRLLAEGRAALAEGGAESDPMFAQSWLELARERAVQGDSAGAEREWLALLAWHSARSAAGDRRGRWSAESAAMGYTAFLMERGRLDDAEAALRPAVEGALAQPQSGKRSALAAHAWRLQALFWIAAQKGDAALAARWLDGWERSLGAAHAKRNANFALGRLAVADLARDEKTTASAREALAALSGTEYLCRAELRRNEAGVGAYKDALIARYAVCKKV